ncbi:MAG TPA: hypothetical protein VNQ73_01735 [Ilumatobacter sp.]|nr:hypothetical protein [Ilumatobacter sp.]
MSSATGRFRDDVIDIEYQFAPTDVAGGETFDYAAVGMGFEAIDTTTFSVDTVTHQQWRVGCVDPDGEHHAGPSHTFWVPMVSHEVIVPSLLAELRTLVTGPSVFFPVAQPDTGWLTVKTPMEIRVEPVAPIRLEVAVENVTGRVEAWAQATPVRVVFHPGEPMNLTHPEVGAPVTCTYEQVTMGWDPAYASGCWYRYHNSSAISPTARFLTRTRVVWQVDTSSPAIAGEWESYTDVEVGVAEVQAVVIAP